MNQELIDRYLYAVTRRMPKAKQEDVAQELRGLIDDMLAERCGDRTPKEKDIRVVLTELGSPQDLFNKYDEDGGKCLIGQPYYSTYKSVLKIVLIAVAVGMTIASIILCLVEPMEAVVTWNATAKLIAHWIVIWLGNVYNGLLSAFAIVTVLFAFFYKKNVPLGQPFNFDDLPPVPKKKETISKTECYVGIAISVVFLVVFLTAPQIFCAILTETKQVVPIFDPAMVRKTWYLIVLFAVCGITREIVKLMEGRYNKTVLVTKVVCNLASAVLSIWWLRGFDLMNPEFVDSIAALFSGDAEFIIRIFSNFQLFFLGCILVALVLDTLEGVIKTVRK